MIGVFNMKKTIFLVIPNHIFTSDLLRTRYIKYLSSKYKVVVFTPFIDEELAKRKGYLKSDDVIYIKWNIQSPRFWSLFKFLRISCVNEFDYLTSIRYWYKRPNYTEHTKRKIIRILSLPFKKILTAKFFYFLEKKLLPRSKKFEFLVNQHKPSLLITATPGFNPLEAELITFSQKIGLRSVAMNFTWDNLTMNCKHIRKTDYLITWNSVMKKEATDIHDYPEEKIFVSGAPRFDPYFDKRASDPGREEFLKSKNLDPQYKTIFYTTVTKAYPFQKKYIQDLIELRKKGKIPYVNLFMRIHPLDLFETYKEFLNEPNCHFEKAAEGIKNNSGKEMIEMGYKDMLNLKHSLKYTDININYASTISIEAAIFDEPIINIGFINRFALAYEFNHYEPIYKSGAVRLVKKDRDLPELINMYLKNHSLDSNNRKKIVDEYVEFTDGLSYKRSVDFLDQIL